MRGALDRAFAWLAASIAARPRRVLLIVAAFVVAAAPFAVHVRSALEPRGFDVAGSNSERARTMVEAQAGFDPANSVLLLFRGRSLLQTPASRKRLQTLQRKLAADPAIVRVLDAESTGNPALTGRDGRSTYLIGLLRPLDDKAAEAAGKRIRRVFADERDVTLGGNPVANSEISETIEHDLRRAELLSVPLIVVLSFFLFRGFVASLLAPVAGLVTVLVSFFLLRMLVELTTVSIYALNLVTGLSVGLSIDWSLLLISRLREERTGVGDDRQALRRALVAVGEPILFSALTVAVSMATLLIFPLRFLRSMGFGGIIAALVALATALVVLPSVLSLLGDRLESLSLPRWRRQGRRRSKTFAALGELATRRPALVAVVIVVVFVVIAGPVMRIRWTTVDASSLPSTSAAFRANAVINESRIFVRHGGTPAYVVVHARPARARRLTSRIRPLAGVRVVSPPRRLRGQTWMISVVFRDGPYTVASQRTVAAIRRLGAGVAVGGEAAAFHDERSAIASRLPLALVILCVGMLVILFALTGAVIAPLLALVMNALTLAAAFGILVLVFQDGRLHDVLAFTSSGALDLTIPLVLAAIVFAIATDYGVFLISRIAEVSRDGERSSIAGAVGVVGPIVAAAAVLFAVSIGIFGSSGIIVLKILGVGTAVAVIIDAILVRSLLLPAALSLLGRRAWWPARRRA